MTSIAAEGMGVQGAGFKLCKINSLSITGFKNHPSLELSFSERIVAFTGANGSGKTNLLDAIHYLSLLRSYFPISEAQAISFGASFYTLFAEGEFGGEYYNSRLSYAQNERKRLWFNESPVESLSGHIGRVPLVIIAPGDILLLMEGNEVRRRFFNQVLSQADSAYLKNLQTYNRLLERRNLLLSEARYGGIIDHTLLDVIDMQMEKPAQYIIQRRSEFFSEIGKLVSTYYGRFVSNNEDIELIYNPAIGPKDWQTALKAGRSVDIESGRSMLGPHRDEIDLTLNQLPVRKFGSQGQIKSVVIALKLAIHNYLTHATGKVPLLLLDDIFEKIDSSRIMQLMRILAGPEIGMVFITDTEAMRVTKAFENHLEQPQIINLPI